MAKKNRSWTEGDVEQLFVNIISDFEELVVLQNGLRYRMKERNDNNKIPDIAGLFNDGIKLIVEAKDLVYKETEGIEQLKGYLQTAINSGEKALGVFVAGETATKLYMKCYFTDNDGSIKEVEPLKSKSTLNVIARGIKIMRHAIKEKEHVITDVEKDIIKDLALLHEFVRNYGKVSANEKVILLNAIMIALNSVDFINHLEKDIEDKNFSKRIHTATFSQIGLVSNDEVQTAIKSAISFLDVDGHPMNDPNNVPKENLRHYSHIKPTWDGKNVTHLSFAKFICNFIWNDIMKPLKAKYQDSKIDISSKFYNEFLKYTKADGKDLGIVLTPPHISDLMIDLLDLKVDDRLLDICTGSGAFLISGLKKKVSLIKTDDDEKSAHSGLIGVEMQPHMYVLAFANMLFNGGDLNGLFYGSCYDEKIINKIQQLKPTCAILNPPYSMYKNSTCEIKLHEWSFVKHALDLVEKGGKVAVIIPTSCGIHNETINNQLKKELLDNHRLDSIIQCNDQLFYPTGTITNIYVFTAKIPHKENKGHMTFTATFKEDGYEVKRKGRILTGDFEKLKKELFNNLDNMKSTSKSNVLKINDDDEWDYVMADICPELTEGDLGILEKTKTAAIVKHGEIKIVLFSNGEIINSHLTGGYISLISKSIDNVLESCDNLILYNDNSNIQYDPNLCIIENDVIKLINQEIKKKSNKNIDTSSWKSFKLTDLFEISKGKDKDEEGKYPLITCATSNRGKHQTKTSSTFVENVFTVSGDGVNTGTAFWQNEKVGVFTNVNILKPLFKYSNNICSFLEVIMTKQLSPKYNYGKKLGLTRILEESIFLPVKNDQPDWEYMEEFMNNLIEKE